jgi:membrane-associated phospholipid phosphatase
MFAPLASRCRIFAVSAVCLSVLAAAPAVQADSPARAASKFASGSGNIIYLAAAVGLPLLSDGSHAKNHALRAADAIGTSVILSEGLKNLFHEKRPDSNAHDSFPSGHATAAFAAATVESDLHPKQAALWFTGATLISYSRIRLHRHYGRDVIAGALLGYGTARLELSAPRGLLLSPFIQPESRSLGVQMTMPLR